MSTNNNWRWSDDDSDRPVIERIPRRNTGDYEPEDIPAEKRIYQDNDAFKCCRCKAWVENDPEVCGVKHRNHCPYCLVSRHVNELKAGDRRSDCRAAMRPVGLTLKRSHNKYAVDDGELMLIHLCLGCGKLSINRIAADDNAEKLLSVFNSSGEIDPQLLERIEGQDIRLLGRNDLNLVLSRLYGTSGIRIEELVPEWESRLLDSEGFE
jgi:hypothetical protein